MDDCKDIKNHKFQLNSQEEATAALNRLHDDSQLTSSKRIQLINPILVREAIVSGPAVIASEYIGIAVAAGAAKALIVKKEIDDTIRTHELKNEKCAIQKNFQDEIKPAFVGDTATKCLPSARQVGITMAMHTLQGGAYGVASGLVMAPTSRGISVPIWGMAGLLSGSVGGVYELQRGSLECQVSKMRSEVLSHWQPRAEH